MIIGLVILALSLAWFLYETKFLTIRLESYGYRKFIAEQKAKSNSVVTQEVVFKPLDMPEVKGSLNIACKICE